MLKRLAALLCLTVACSSEQPQVEPVDQGEVAAVTAAIQQVFDGMRARDSAMVGARLAEGAVLYRAVEQDGVPELTTSSVEGWLEAVGRQDGPTLDEQIWDLEIQIDDRLAMAWMKYTFFRGGELSHCGVNAMMLFKDSDGWKIFSLADTARRDENECWMPPGWSEG